MTQATHACNRCGADISHLRKDARWCRGCPRRPKPQVFPDRECASCGVSFTPKRRDSTCCTPTCVDRSLSRKYSAAKKAAVANLTCPRCGTEFKPWRTDQKYCTGLCGSRYRARANYIPADLSDRSCAYCGKTFTPKRTSSTLCSRECSRRTSYARHQSERIAKAVAWARANPEARAAIANQHKARRRAWESNNPGSVGIATSDWLKTLRRYEGRCAYCGGTDGGIHMEHVVPVSRGGAHSIGNVLPACRPCNLSKGAKLLVEWRRAITRWQAPVSTMATPNASGAGRQKAKAQLTSDGERPGTSTAA